MNRCKAGLRHIPSQPVVANSNPHPLFAASNDPRISETYQRMELEKKRNKVSRRADRGPVVRYHSVTMPLIEALPPEGHDEINVVGDADTG